MKEAMYICKNFDEVKCGVQCKVVIGRERAFKYARCLERPLDLMAEWKLLAVGD